MEAEIDGGGGARATERPDCLIQNGSMLGRFGATRLDSAPPVPHRLVACTLLVLMQVQEDEDAAGRCAAEHRGPQPSRLKTSARQPIQLRTAVPIQERTCSTSPVPLP